ncbi:hypothetical protein [Bifidobacterium pseudocatenulatum]|uniref:hypothetical protein n=1 Tax=Bifidobacterium pseudocatenulatum TaxID=28026 RepID=UPI0034A15782
MANPSKSKGTSLETWTVRYLAWALQDTRIDRMPLHGNNDQGDLIGVMFHGEPVCVECKDTHQPNYRKHWRELKVEMANMDTPLRRARPTPQGRGREKPQGHGPTDGDSERGRA